jgi:prophage regulatory protein
MQQDKIPQANRAPFPLDGFVRVNQIIGDPAKGIAPFFPVSRSQWFLGIKQGIYPKGRKLSKRVTVWKAQDVRDLIDFLSGEVA